MMRVKDKYTYEGPKDLIGIYAILDPRDLNEFRYLGQTVRGIRRFGSHLEKGQLAKKDYKANFLKSLIRENIKPHFKAIITLKITDKMTEADVKIFLDRLEIDLIAYYFAIGHRLTNGTDGGGGMMHGPHNPKKGRPVSAETREKLSKAATGRPGLKGPLNPNHGKPLTAEVKAKLSLANSGENNANFGRTGDKHPLFGIVYSVEYKRQQALAHGVRPFCDDLGNVFYSHVEAVEFHGLKSRSNVGKVLAGERKTTGKRNFRYLTDKDIVENNTIINFKPYFINSLAPFEDENGNLYTTQEEAATKLKMSQTSIWQVLTGQKNSISGHTFKYVDPEGFVSKKAA